MKIVLAGTGCGSIGSMTLEVLNAISKADLLIGAPRLLESIPADYTAERQPAIAAKDILDVIRAKASSEPDANICVLYSGDSGFYSGTRSLMPLLEEAGLTACVLPGISSIQAFASKLQEPWQDWLLVSAHGKDCDAVTAVMQGKPVFFLTGGDLGPGELCKQLCDAGLGNLEVIIGERLSYEDERIVSGTASEFAWSGFDSLAVMLARPADCAGDMTPGIADSEFVRGNVPMTKRDVRAAILAHMQIQPEDILWDVGAGTGSVSIEMAMKASRGRVYALERNHEGFELMSKNRCNFGVWNLTLLEGSAPDDLIELPAPDKVFIGGSGGRLRKIIQLVLEKNPQALICVTAIVLETLHDAVDEMTAAGMDVEIVQIASSTARPVGGKHMMMASNPIYIITGQRPQDAPAEDKE